MSSPLPENRITFFQLLLLLLSIIVLSSLLLDAVVPVPPEVSRLIQLLDTVVCILFFFDFVVRFRLAEKKLAFLKWGWIDLIASVPTFDILRWGRLVRIFQIIRVLRAIRSFQRFLAIILRNRTRNGVTSLFVTFLLLIVFSSIAILMCEDRPDANIHNAEDAVWWSVTTITTVGYGDKYPTTMSGRAVAMVLMLAGVGLFGTLSGLIASYFLGTEQSRENGASEIVASELRALHAKVDDLIERTKVK